MATGMITQSPARRSSTTRGRNVFHHANRAPRSLELGPISRDTFRSRLRVAALCLLPFVVVSGCVSHGQPPDDALGLQLVVEPCANLRLSARLLELEGDLHVDGAVQATGGRSTVPGHVDVEVQAPDGSQWASAQASYRTQMQTRLRGDSPGAGFDATFGGLPPAGSIVTVRHHDGPHGG